jgi:hypothetical protein
MGFAGVFNTLMRRALIAAVVCLLAFPAFAGAAGTSPPTAEELSDYVTDVPGSTGYHYGLRDNRGNSMTALKVIPNPQGGYLGAYHVLIGSQFVIKLASSTNLLNWTYVRDLASSGAQPTIGKLGIPGDETYLLSYESSSGCSGRGGAGGYCLRFLRYASISALLSGTPYKTFTVPRTLSDCQEGTPNVTTASIDSLGKLVLNVAFHYSPDCIVDRQAKGTLVDFSSWSAQIDTSMNTLFETATPPIGANGSVRDRDIRGFRKLQFNLQDAQLVSDDRSTWRTWLYDWQTNAVSNLNVHTHGGSTSFGHPTITNIQNSDGSGRLIVTYYVYAEGAVPGEAGELIFYRDYDPTIVAAGDISKTSISGQKLTSDLIAANPATAVLPLGDNQYDTGTLTNFNTYYGTTWGRFKGSTFPTPGNHDKCPDSGYDEYFGKPCWYSFDLGNWHIISLDSNVASDTAQLSFLDHDLASTTKPCVLAFWHHPRFSSGATHGNSTRTAPFWTRLYNANADVILSAHDHIYERFAPQDPNAVRDDARGIRSFLVGTGGSSLYSIGTIRANSEVRYVAGFGVLRMTLHPTGYEWRFESEAGKTFTDVGSASCH